MRDHPKFEVHMHQQNRIRLGYDAPKARGSILMKTHYTVVLAALELCTKVGDGVKG